MELPAKQTNFGQQRRIVKLASMENKLSVYLFTEMIFAVCH